MSDRTRSPVFSIGRGHLMVLAAACLWSMGGLFIKVLTGPCHVAPEAVACLRCAIAGGLLSWALPGLAGAARGRTVAAGLAYTVIVGSFVFSTAGTTAANAILLQYAYPVFVALGAVFLFGESLSRRTVLALALGMGGIAVILFCSWTPAEKSGLTYGVISSFAFAAFTLISRSPGGGNPMALASFCNLMAAGLLLLPAIGVLRVSAQALLLLTLMAAIQLGIPYVLFIRGLRIVGATDAALLTLIEPILNPIWVWLGVGEVPHPSTVAGGALILLALVARFAGRTNAVARRAPPG